MLATIVKKITCPYCSENIDIIIDGSVDFQEYTEDCFVCCQPIVISVLVSENDNVEINAISEQEC